MLKIIWLNDFTRTEIPTGGAEITDSHVIAAGREMGHTITVCRPHDFMPRMLRDTDLIVFSNNFNFPTQLRLELMHMKPYVSFVHDCGRWALIAKRHPYIFEKGLATVFLSPGHQAWFKDYLKDAKNVFAIPPHLLESFCDYGKERSDRLVYVGNLHEGKGLLNILEFAKNNPSVEVDFFYGRTSDSTLKRVQAVKNCHLMGTISRENLPGKLNEYAAFIHLPVEYEAFGRAVGEATLCGCQIIGNDKIGALTYNVTAEELREITLRPHYLFWEKIQESWDTK